LHLRDRPLDVVISRNDGQPVTGGEKPGQGPEKNLVSGHDDLEFPDGFGDFGTQAVFTLPGPQGEPPLRGQGKDLEEIHHIPGDNESPLPAAGSGFPFQGGQKARKYIIKEEILVGWKSAGLGIPSLTEMEIADDDKIEVTVIHAVTLNQPPADCKRSGKRQRGRKKPGQEGLPGLNQ